MNRTASWPRIAALILIAGVGFWGFRAAGNANLRADVLEQFEAFCLQHFGAEKEPAMYRAFGPDIRFPEGGSWMHVSVYSAVMAWETSLPATTHIEFGPTPDCEERTTPSKRPHFIHVHYLRGLKPQTTYHYRIVVTDERGRTFRGPTATFTTRDAAGMVRIPGDLPGPPFMLDRPQTYYLVTEDIVADSTAMGVAADGITLDLGGHTITYDDKAGSPDPSADESLFGHYGVRGPCGIRTADGRGPIAVVNGTIRQGAGKGGSRPAGYNPVFIRRPRRIELAGITAEYVGSQVSGIVVNNSLGTVDMHHNVLVDRGTEMFNRHSGMAAIVFDTGRSAAGGSRCHHNLVRRTRHRGISVGSGDQCYANEIYVDGYATNSYGVMFYSNRQPVENLQIRDNRIFATGFHPVGIGAGFHAKNVLVSGNYIQVQGTEPDPRWLGDAGSGRPVGAFHTVNGVRIQKGPQENVEYRENTIVVKGRSEGCLMRGFWLAPLGSMRGVVLRDNHVKLLAEDQHAEGHAVAALGSGKDDPEERVTLVGNRIESNLCNLRFGDVYGYGGRRYRFFDNTFVRLGDDPRYNTIRIGWNSRPEEESFGNLFVDTKLEGGASFDNVFYDTGPSGRFDFSVAWTLTLSTDPGARVLIRDRQGQEVFSAAVPPDGQIAVPLVQYVQRPDGKTVRTPHTVTVAKDGKEQTREITLEGPVEVGL